MKLKLFIFKKQNMYMQIMQAVNKLEIIFVNNL